MITAGEFFSAYKASIFEYLLELYVFYLLFALKLRKRKYFPLRFAAAFAAICAVALPVTLLYVYAGNTVIGRSTVYILLFALSVLTMWFCCDESPWTVICFCVGAYAVQNLGYKLFLIIWYLGESTNVFPQLFQVEYGVYTYYIFYYAVFALISAGLYFLFVRRLSERIGNSELNYKILIISVLILFITVVLCTVLDIHKSEQSWLILQTGNMFSVVGCVSVLLLLFNIVVKQSLENEVKVLRRVMYEREKQYEVSKETIDAINLKCHDMRHRIQMLRDKNGNISSDDFDDFETAVSIYDSAAKTGNQSLDVIITEKTLLCNRKGIRFSCMADGGALAFMSDIDVYCLFGNIIDNAVEAADKLTDQDKKVIDLSVRSKDGFAVIEAENFFAGELEFRDGLPITTKNDRRYHGFGIRSIRAIAEKYGGKTEITTEGEIFRISILFMR